MSFRFLSVRGTTAVHVMASNDEHASLNQHDAQPGHKPGQMDRTFTD